MNQPEIASSGFRKAGIHQRRKIITNADSISWDAQDLVATSADPSMLDLADVMVENAVGIMPVPLGIAQGFLIDEERLNIPLAVEEPSVIAAASYSANLIARHGGFTTETIEPVMTGQVYVDFPEISSGFTTPSGTKPGSLPTSGAEIQKSPEQPLPDAIRLALSALETHAENLKVLLDPILEPMEKRGGGFRGFQFTWNQALGMIRIHFFLNVQDAMGANLINTCAEALRTEVERLTGGSVLMGILSNGSEGRLTKARFSLPFSALKRGQFSGIELAHRIVRGFDIARLDPARAVTHNKGIMNGITSLALATANDTRGIEAAAHAWAARSGQYTSLSRYWIQDEQLNGELELPLAFATVGGGVGFHPAARANLKLLNNPSAVRLGAIAAALGLAQNFAALSALTGEGIQSGHMRLHAGRLAYSAGARGDEIPRLQALLVQEGRFNIPTARDLLTAMRNNDQKERDL